MTSDHQSPTPFETTAGKQATEIRIGGTDDSSILEWELSHKHLPLFQAACVLHDAVARRRPNRSFQILVLINGPAHWAEFAGAFPRVKDAIIMTAKELRRAHPSATSIGMPDLYRWAQKHGVLDRDSLFAKHHQNLARRTTRASRLGRAKGQAAPTQLPADGRGKHFDDSRKKILAAAIRYVENPRAGVALLKANGSLNGTKLALELEDLRAQFGLPESNVRGFSHEQLERVIRLEAQDLGKRVIQRRT